MSTRTYYLQPLIDEPFSFDLQPAWKEFESDFAFDKKMDANQRFVHWQGRVYRVGLGKFKAAVIITIRAVVFDIFALGKASFKCVFTYRDLPGLKNVSFCLWNLTIADSALVLSVFTGILAPSSRKFAENIHKGDIYLNLFPRVQTPEEAEKELELLEKSS